MLKFVAAVTAACVLLCSSGCTMLGKDKAVFSAPNYLSQGKEWRMYPVVTDFDADGKLDILATHRRPLSENSLHIFKGAGDGSFTDLEQNWSSPGYSGLAVADLNADNNPDIVAASHFNRIQTYLSKASGGFKETLLQSLDGYVSANLVDIDGDKKLEAVLLGNERAGIEIYKMAQSGDWVLYKHLSPGHIGRDLKILDFNNDGRLDFVVSFARDGVQIILQMADGNFSAPTSTGFFSNSKEFRNVDVLDLNGDGILDMALNGGFSGMGRPNGPDVYLGQADGKWLASNSGLKVLKNAAEALSVRDFNRDGFLDLLVGGNVTGEIKEKGYGLFLFLGDGKGNWTLSKRSGLLDRGLSRPYGIVATDLNKDNLLDLVITHGAPEEGLGYISVWLGANS